MFVMTSGIHELGTDQESETGRFVFEYKVNKKIYIKTRSLKETY